MKKFILGLLLSILSVTIASAEDDKEREMIKRASIQLSQAIEKALSHPELLRLNLDGTRVILFIKIVQDNKLHLFEVDSENTEVASLIKKHVEGLKIQDVYDFSGRFFKVPVEFKD